MTDKQIINDVQECEFLQEGHCNLYFNSEISDIYPNCIDISECNYKQLKAKYNEFVSRYKAKEQECEKLKKQVSDLLNKPEIQDKILWKIDNEALLGSKDAWIYKLEQTLAEIKPILEFYANSNMGEEQPDKTYNIMLNGSYIMVYDPKPARQALQKISEVLEDE